MVCISSSTPPSAATPTPTRPPFPTTPLFSSLLFFSISTPTPTPIPLFLSVPLTLRLFVVLTPGLFFGSLSCLLPFLNVFYRRIGLSESKIGVLSLVRPWASGAAALLSALVVDRFGRHGTLMLLGSVISLAARMSTLFGEGLAPGSAVQVALLSFLVLVTEMGSGPVFVIADAVTMGGRQPTRRRRVRQTTPVGGRHLRSMCAGVRGGGGDMGPARGISDPRRARDARPRTDVST